MNFNAATVVSVQCLPTLCSNARRSRCLSVFLPLCTPRFLCGARRRGVWSSHNPRRPLHRILAGGVASPPRYPQFLPVLLIPRGSLMLATAKTILQTSPGRPSLHLRPFRFRSLCQSRTLPKSRTRCRLRRRSNTWTDLLFRPVICRLVTLLYTGSLKTTSIRRNRASSTSRTSHASKGTSVTLFMTNGNVRFAPLGLRMKSERHLPFLPWVADLQVKRPGSPTPQPRGRQSFMHIRCQRDLQRMRKGRAIRISIPSHGASSVAAF